VSFNRLVNVILITLAFPGVVLAGNTTAQAGADNVIQGTCVADMVQYLRYHLRVAICFEQTPDYDNNRITLGYVQDNLMSKPADQLSKSEQQYVAAVKAAKAMQPFENRNTAIGHREVTFDFTYSASMSPDEVLKSLVAHDPRHTLTRDGNLYVIRYKYSGIDFRSDFKLKSSTVADGYHSLGKTLYAGGIETVFSGGGFPHLNDSTKRLDLNLENADLVTLLDRFCESLGPRAGWNIMATPDYKFVVVSFY
jgi:hypothetical protein